jgi:hypothetical protein
LYGSSQNIRDARAKVLVTQLKFVTHILQVLYLLCDALFLFDRNSSVRQCFKSHDSQVNHMHLVPYLSLFTLAKHGMGGALKLRHEGGEGCSEDSHSIADRLELLGGHGEVLFGFAMHILEIST